MSYTNSPILQQNSANYTFEFPSDAFLSQIDQLPSEATWNEMSTFSEQDAASRLLISTQGTGPGGDPGGRPPLPIGSPLMPLMIIAALYSLFTLAKAKKKKITSSK